MLASNVALVVEAVLQVVKVLLFSPLLVVQLPTLAVLRLSAVEPRLALARLQAVAASVDVSVFDHVAGLGAERVRVDVGLGIAVQVLSCIAVELDTLELLWILRLDTSDQLVQEELLV